MNATINFREFIDVMRPSGLLLFFNDRAQVLTAGEQVDQAAMIKDVFGGRWPHMG